MITPVKYDKYGSSIELKKLMTKGNMENDQDNIRIVKVENDIDTIKGQVKCLQTVEDLRDEQMKALQSALKKTIAYIERDGYEWKVLDVLKAKEWGCG